MLLPEGEWHEIALLFAQYLIKEANHEVIYLGQSVPYSDVLAIGAAKRLDFILFSSSISHTGFKLGRYLEDLGGAFPDKKILYCANNSGELTNERPKNLIYLQQIIDLSDFIQSIS